MQAERCPGPRRVMLHAFRDNAESTERGPGPRKVKLGAVRDGFERCFLFNKCTLYVFLK